MRSLPGQLSLFEIDAGDQPQSTVAQSSPSSARVGAVDEAVQAARVRRAGSETTEVGADRPHRGRPAADPRDSRSPEHAPDSGPRNASPGSGLLLSPEDVARRCGLSRKAVYRAVARGELRAARILSRLRIDPSDVEAWLRANIVEPGRPTPASVAARSPASKGLRRLLPGT